MPKCIVCGGRYAGYRPHCPACGAVGQPDPFAERVTGKSLGMLRVERLDKIRAAELRRRARMVPPTWLDEWRARNAIEVRKRGDRMERAAESERRAAAQDLMRAQKAARDAAAVLDEWRARNKAARDAPP